MRLLNLLFKREMAAPMLAMSFASCVTVLLVVVRIVMTGHWFYGCLAWNLFLAWLPMVFASLAGEAYDERAAQPGRFWGAAAAWLVFFPNAPYIFTDIVHLTTYFYMHFWVDLTLILLCALTGFVVGFVSLYLMQSLVRRMFGRVASWVFIAAVAGLSSLGICIGRFLRFNSWDVLVRPVALYHTIGDVAANAPARHVSGAFMVLFATFFFLGYLMLYALTHLSPLEPAMDDGSVQEA